jgi:hypothetical protein
MSEEQPVLIVTEPLDVHADFVISELKKRDVPVFRFHTEDFPASSQISISGAGTAWSAEIRTPLRSLRLDDVRAAWLRRPGDPVIDHTVRPEIREFAVEQARSTLTALSMPLSLLALHRDHHPVGPGKYPCPPPVRVKGHKPGRCRTAFIIACTFRRNTGGKYTQ